MVVILVSNDKNYFMIFAWSKNEHVEIWQVQNFEPWKSLKAKLRAQTFLTFSPKMQCSCKIWIRSDSHIEHQQDSIAPSRASSLHLFLQYLHPTEPTLEPSSTTRTSSTWRRYYEVGKAVCLVNDLLEVRLLYDPVCRAVGRSPFFCKLWQTDNPTDRHSSNNNNAN